LNIQSKPNKIDKPDMYARDTYWKSYADL